MLLPQEGHELVRARHPGSAKIQEFLIQLGGLWEELRRRHQRNAVFLQTSEELGFRVNASEKCLKRWRVTYLRTRGDIWDDDGVLWITFSHREKLYSG